MGKVDTITKEYMRNPEIFADVFNQFLYHGEQVIHSENLTELDTVEIVIPYGESGAGIPEQKYRDVLKLMMTDSNAAYCILGIENQNDIHYAMPVKNMVYDSMQLAHQVVEAAKLHRKKQKDNDDVRYKPSTSEYLSGFYKTDKLLPVITLTIFFGAEEWDAPLSLKEMYSTNDKVIMQYVSDYKVNLITPARMSEEEIREFKTSFKEVMLYVKYSQDKTKLQEITQAYPNFRSLDRQAAEVINAVTHSKLKYPQGKGKIDMCVAIQEMVADGEAKGRLEGRLEGAIKTYKEVGFSLQETVQRIANSYNFSLQESKEKVEQYW